MMPRSLSSARRILLLRVPNGKPVRSANSLWLKPSKKVASHWDEDGNRIAD